MLAASASLRSGRPGSPLSGKDRAAAWNWHIDCGVRCTPSTQEASMTRDELTRKILAAKRAKGLTWKTIVAEIGGGSAVYLTAALMGQMKLRPEQADRAAKLFELGEDESLLLQEIPYRGSLPTVVPTDP